MSVIAAEGKVRAPELPDNLDWVNCNFSPSIAASKGKVVVLYFWTYSNINSLNLLLELRAVENKYENGLVLIGIHCPKFPHEAEAAQVLKAVNRLFLRHPIACDNDYSAWQAYGINAWPSMALIDAEGNLRQILRGEDAVRQADRSIGEYLNAAAASDSRNYGRVRTERRPEPRSSLSFPCGVLAARGLLYIADTANNRILECRQNGRVTRVFGSGNPGFWDGTLENCGFSSPRSLVLFENYIYVADTGNHAIRRINLFNGEVETLAGNGKPSRMVVRGHREIREVKMTSPMGLAINGPELYISMAGMHQLWKLDLKEGTIGWFSGTGQAWMIDGEPTQAAFGLPVGLAVCEPFVYVADADASAIREVRCQSGQVQSRVGRGTYMFGYEDGAANRALLQYPMDVAVDGKGQQLWIADSFNNALRVVDLKSGSVETPELEYEFAEPAGLCMTGEHLWVANTNAHEIVRIEISSRQCEKLEISETSF